MSLTGPGGAIRPGSEDALLKVANEYPNSKAGARAFPRLVPLAPGDPGATTARDVLTALRADQREVLLLWAAEDRPLPVAMGERFASELGRPAPRVIEGAGHFLQEDRGAEIGAIVADWLG